MLDFILMLLMFLGIFFVIVYVPVIILILNNNIGPWLYDLEEWMKKKLK